MRKCFIPLILACLFNLNSVTAQIITTIAGKGTSGYSGDNGAATAAEFSFTQGVAVDNKNNVYVADYLNNRVRKINTAGIITTIAGVGTPGFLGNGGPATAAELSAPTDIALDKNGNIFIADRHNFRVRKIDTFGIITTIAGGGGAGYNGEGAATTKQLNYPWGIAVDNLGNVYIADEFNDRVRKINSAGMITTVAGNGTYGYNGDNIDATAAQLKHPVGIAADKNGNIYFSESNRIRKVNPAGIITTICGNGISGYSGDNGPATAAGLAGATNISLDSTGNLYINDGNRIRKINYASNKITTIAGNGTSGFSGDNGPATSAKIAAYSGGLSVDTKNNLYFADTDNERIRKINFATTGIASIYSITDIQVYPNPASDILTVKIMNLGQEYYVSLVDIYGKLVLTTRPTSNSTTSFQINSIPSGNYLLNIYLNGLIHSEKVSIHAN